jgi:hypothetical protein
VYLQPLRFSCGVLQLLQVAALCCRRKCCLRCCLPSLQLLMSLLLLLLPDTQLPCLLQQAQHVRCRHIVCGRC